MTGFGEALRAWRTARSLTQEELADRARLTVQAVGALERGERRRPHPRMVRVLAEALELGDDDRAVLVALVPGRPPASGRGSVRTETSGPGARRAPVAPVQAADPTARVRVEAPVVGRDDEIARVSALLRARQRRVVTLTGPGGVGKTALATVVVDRVRDDFPGGVVVVELVELTEAAGVLPAIARALGAPEVRDSSARALAPLIEGRRLLVVLCNVEHLLDVAPEMATLVRACPDLVVLATSRAPLRIGEEHEVRVAPLGPDEAVLLFRERMAASGAELEGDVRTDAAVGTLCGWTDGLPLAVELTASAAARLGPVMLAERLGTAPPLGLRDLPERQQTMAATLAWSLDVLSASARGLLARLSVCGGTFSLEIAEAIGTGVEGDLIPALAELLDHSLVSLAGEIEGTQRFRLLEPVRQDAATRLTTSQRTDARSALADALRTTVTELAAHLHDDRSVPAVRSLEVEMGNIRVAVEALLDQERPDDVADLIFSARRFFTVNRHTREGLAWLRRLDDRPMSDPARARALMTAGCLGFITGDLPRVRSRLTDAARVARRAGDASLIAEAEVMNATAAVTNQEIDAARELLAAAEDDLDRADVAEWRFYARVAAAEIAVTSGDLEEADRALRDAASLARLVGSPRITSILFLVRGDVDVLHGDHAAAAQRYADAAELAVRAGDAWMLGHIVVCLAGVAARRGETTTAAWFVGASTTYAGEQSVAIGLTQSEQQAGRSLSPVRDDLGEAAFDQAWRAGRVAGPTEIVTMAHEVAGRTP